MDNFMQMTKKLGHRPELLRLAALDATYDDALGGNLVLAPVDMGMPGKKILDSGTADGTWLRGVRSKQSVQHDYYGSDVEGELFPEDPDGITYFAHSFKNPWPEQYHSIFDLVHIRGSMAGSAPEGPALVIKNLLPLLKPGGWVQLMEMNGSSPPQNGPAMTDFAKMAIEMFTAIGAGDFANNSKRFLEEAGFQNVQERRVLVNLGKMAKPELHDISIHGVTGPIVSLTSVAKSNPSCSFTHEQLDALPIRVKAELESQGGRMEAVIAFGQKA
ncbi:methyltransferase SirN-like protein [Hypoxylon cercidicola]|nr:methyltransferase SirN-like protein [Hypoxylon cercidicola]